MRKIHTGNHIIDNPVKSDILNNSVKNVVFPLFFYLFFFEMEQFIEF